MLPISTSDFNLHTADTLWWWSTDWVSDTASPGILRFRSASLTHWLGLYSPCFTCYGNIAHYCCCMCSFQGRWIEIEPAPRRISTLSNARCAFLTLAGLGQDPELVYAVLSFWKSKHWSHQWHSSAMGTWTAYKLGKMPLVGTPTSTLMKLCLHISSV
jgi:hypothetical protein